MKIRENHGYVTIFEALWSVIINIVDQKKIGHQEVYRDQVNRISSSGNYPDTMN